MKTCDDPGHDNYDRLCCTECGEPSIEEVVAENERLRAELQERARVVVRQHADVNRYCEELEAEVERLEALHTYTVRLYRAARPIDADPDDHTQAMWRELAEALEAAPESVRLEATLEDFTRQQIADVGPAWEKHLSRKEEP